MRYLKKTCAVTLSAAMVLGLAATAGNVSYAATNVEKEETVYVNLDSDGTVDDVTVSNWLKNVTGTSDVQDVSNLKDIKNVKGDETFTQNGDKLTWKANDADIYYQGTTNKDLPVSMEIKYYLDGVQVSPSDLGGKSGHLKIEVNYTNNVKNKTKVGKKTTSYTVKKLKTGNYAGFYVIPTVKIGKKSYKSDATWYMKMYMSKYY